MTSSPLAETRKLVALTAFVAQKALLLAGEPLFQGTPASPDALGQKRSQLDRLCAEIADRLAACRPADPGEAAQAAVLRAFGEGLDMIGREAEGLSRALAAWNRPPGVSLESLHSLYEAAAILAAQAVGALVEETKGNRREIAENLRRNHDAVARLEAAPGAAAAASLAAPIRSIARQARRLAREAAALLVPVSPRLPGHFHN